MNNVLLIGGSDSSGGAGLQADLKTLSALGVHGSTVVTAVTAQSSTAVHGSWDVPPDAVRAQLQAVLADLRVDAVKTGMLATEATVLAVAETCAGRMLVVDPVGLSTTGQSLLDARGHVAVRTVLLPVATLVTPNLAEVQALTGMVVTGEADLREAADRVLALGPSWVLVKGGHLPGEPVDLLSDGSTYVRLPGARISSRHTHGTGCTLASALAGHLALGASVPEAAVLAKQFVRAAISAGYPMGTGAGPVNPAAHWR